MAVAIIGGTITSTLLTLLIVPTFYDSIEIARDRALAKFQRRVPRFTVLGAFVMTLVEAVLALVMVRFVFRLIVKAGRLVTGRRATGPVPG
jgi:HAE1 family hydrophobic/amphiphilic exporter-1